jgi:ABC-2 type transport system ATP-binding protein
MARTPLDEATDAHAAEAVRAEDLIVKCVGLTKVFRDFWLRNRVTAVDHIDLDIRRGEVFGLLGPNGSGKSTAIKMILGLLHPTAGRIAVFGQHPRDVANKNQIGYLPEESYLYRFLNARETLEYYGRLFHQDRATRHRRIDMLLEMVGLDRVARRPVGEYSKGMQRRIGIAQALINDPQLLILDEPTTGLDPIGTRQIKDLILELKQRGKTILLCSHLLADVEDVTDRVAIMYGGKIRRHGDIGDLLTEHEHATITLPALGESDRLRIMDALEKAGLTEARFDQPRVKLEQFFLDIVAEAQQQGAATAGAGNAGQIARFLRGDDEDDQAREGRALIEGLTRGSRATPAPDAAAETPTSEPKPSPGQDVLRELTGKTEPPAAPKKPAAADKDQTPQTSPTQPRRDADRSVIDDLLG